MTDRLTHMFDRILAHRLGFAAIMFAGLSALVAGMYGVYALGYWLAGEVLGTLALFVCLLGILAWLATNE